jgi:toxin YoeB
MRSVCFEPRAWDSYKSLERQQQKKVDTLIKDTQRNGNGGIGHPEPLVGNKAGLYSKRIDDKNRFVFLATDKDVIIYGCSGHYEDK